MLFSGMLYGRECPYVCIYMCIFMEIFIAACLMVVGVYVYVAICLGAVFHDVYGIYTCERCVWLHMY